VSTHTIPVQLPQPLYRRLERLAELTQRSVEAVVAQTLASSLPPLPDDLPEEMRAELIALEQLSDDALWEVARSMVAPEQSQQLSMLLEKNRRGVLSDEEQTGLEQLRGMADRLMLRKAYAYVLLKWRGYRLPTLASLEAQG
jgi:hypothetical protein